MTLFRLDHINGLSGQAVQRHDRTHFSRTENLGLGQLDGFLLFEHCSQKQGAIDIQAFGCGGASLLAKGDIGLRHFFPQNEPLFWIDIPLIEIDSHFVGKPIDPLENLGCCRMRFSSAGGSSVRRYGLN